MLLIPVSYLKLEFYFLLLGKVMKGILLSITASITFGALYFYSQLFHGVDAQQVFAWRMIMTLPFLTLFMFWMKDTILIKRIFIQIKQNPAFIFPLILSSFLSCSQLWLFLWGPINGRGLQVSLGYFLLPLTMVVLGSLVYKEKLSILQWLSTFFAASGIAIGLFNMGGVYWETIYIALGYPLYFVFRRYLKTDHLGGFWWDIALSLPIALGLIIYYFDWASLTTHYSSIALFFLITAGLGFLSTLGLGSYMLASRLLPFALFGLLSYLEPILLAVASFCLGERIPQHNMPIYIGIWLAMLLLALDSTLTYFKQKKSR